ncbi:MAG: 5'/3'-nucleotidase SurE [Alphaproteobacteria bacterium]
MPNCPLPKELEGCRILVTNDDSLSADGIKVLEKIARQFTDDVWVVAPQTQQSGAGHSLTMHRPLRLTQVEERRFHVDGTPTDCMVIAISKVLADKKPDLVLSGVNHGANLGEDVTYSGTIAAAMEATLLGVPAIAFSMDKSETYTWPWETAERFAPDIIRQITSIPWEANSLFSVNFPNLPPEKVGKIRVVPHGQRKLEDDLQERTDPRGRKYYWVGQLIFRDEIDHNSDIAAIADGDISVTPLQMDLTDYDLLKRTRDVIMSSE